MVPESIRIRFEKTGRLRYISHLDLCRTMQPAMIRAKIPLWYTEGFNPHPKMVFAQPLPLFVESKCEFLDIKIVEDISCEELKRRLREAFTDELYVTDVYKPTEKFTEIAYAEYEISGIKVSAEDVKKLLSGAIEIEKKTKSGANKTLDIRPQVRSVTLRPDGVIECVLSASGSEYLNPDIFVRALAASAGIEEPDCDITRIKWYKADGSVFK